MRGITGGMHLALSVYRVIYDMCTQKPPHDYSEELYNRYRRSFETYINARVRKSIF